jgi:hypothetical protein
MNYGAGPEATDSSISTSRALKGGFSTSIPAVSRAQAACARKSSLPPLYAGDELSNGDIVRDTHSVIRF